MKKDKNISVDLLDRKRNDTSEDGKRKATSKDTHKQDKVNDGYVSKEYKSKQKENGASGNIKRENEDKDNQSSKGNSEDYIEKERRAQKDKYDNRKHKEDYMDEKLKKSLHEKESEYETSLKDGSILHTSRSESDGNDSSESQRRKNILTNAIPS